MTVRLKSPTIVRRVVRGVNGEARALRRAYSNQYQKGG